MPDDWRPINSAPRDGTHIELFIPYDVQEADEDDCRAEGYWSWVKHRFRFDGGGDYDSPQPTHWRPL